MKVSKKIALVTGGASGIGAAICEIMAEAGATVLVTDVNETGGQECEDRIKAAGGSAEFHAMDVTSPASIAAMVDGVRQNHGRLDILVNAAGWDRIEPFMDNSPEFWDKIVALNLMGPVRVCRAFLPMMIDDGGGSIVNVASDAGRVGSSGETMYAGSKGGVIAFTKSLAREMVRNQVRVNCVCPGPTDTPLFAELPEKLQDALIRAIPMRRLGLPREVADAVLFFASDRSSYCTGQVLSVSGGLTMAD